MTFRHGRHRADGPHDTDEKGGSPTDTETDPESSGVDREQATDALSDDQRREWRRWIVEDFLPANYGVVPVDHLVETVREREPEDVDRQRVRRALTETLLPALDCRSVLEYDADRELLINYGD